MSKKQLYMNGVVHTSSGLSDLLKRILQIGKINKVTLEYEGSKYKNVFTLESVKCDCCGQVLPNGE